MIKLHFDERKKPLLKGVIHAVGTLGYVFACPWLIQKIPSPLEIPIYFYLISVILNFGSSAIYHLIKWPKHLEIYPKRIDHVMIFIKIGATYYASIITVIPDINPLVFKVLTIGILLGLLIRIFFTKAPKMIIALPYILVAWSGVLDLNLLIKLKERTPEGFPLVLIAGICYTIGAIFYMLKYPRPCPKWIGSHELFHIFTILGASLLTIFIFDFAIPFWLNQNGFEK